MISAANILDAYTRPGRLYRRRGEGLDCYACAHRCHIRPGRSGACKVRSNRDGELYVPWGYVSAAHVDPVEKNPFFHLLPGARAFTFGMLGCNFHCSFCQNWDTSQVLRDEAASGSAGYIQPVTPQQLADLAVRYGAPLLVSSYNEPLITAEWAMDVFAAGQERGLRCAMVSNGYATPEVLAELKPYLTAYKVDLKTLQPAHYRELGGRLQPVLDSIRAAHELGLWVEVVTLVIPGFNDSLEELAGMAEFLVSVSPDIPWHLTAFHPDYRMTDPPPTPAAALQKGAQIGRKAGLRFVYAGNLPGQLGKLEDTRCPGCGALLVRRRGFRIVERRVTPQGACPDCGAAVPGVWA